MGAAFLTDGLAADTFFAVVVDIAKRDVQVTKKIEDRLKMWRPDMGKRRNLQRWVVVEPGLQKGGLITYLSPVYLY